MWLVWWFDRDIQRLRSARVVWTVFVFCVPWRGQDDRELVEGSFLGWWGAGMREGGLEELKGGRGGEPSNYQS